MVKAETTQGPQAGLGLWAAAGLAILVAVSLGYLQLRFRDSSQLLGLGEMFSLACIFAPLWLAALRALRLGRHRALSAWRWLLLTAGLGLFVAGLQLQLFSPFTSLPMMFFSAGSACLLAFAAGPRQPWSWDLGPALGRAPAARERLKGLPWVFLALAIVIPLAAALGKARFPRLNPEQGTEWLFRARGEMANDIPTSPFHQWGALAVALAGSLALLAGAAYLAAFKASRRRWLAFLFAAALAGKFLMAGLSTQGLGILPLKVSSINSDYLATAGRLEAKGISPAEYARHYNSFQLTQETGHAKTKPPGAVLVFWALKALSAGQPWVVALWVMTLSSLTVVPLFFTARRLLGSDFYGVAAALLYLSSPSSLVLSGATIDPLETLVLGLVMWAFVEGITQDAWHWILAAGVMLFAAALISTIFAVHLVFLCLVALALGWQRTRSLPGLVGWLILRLGLLLASALAAYDLFWLWTGREFNYLSVVKVARDIAFLSMQYRPFDFWSWGGMLLYGGYLGLALSGLLAYQALSSLWSVTLRSVLAALAIPLLVGLFLWGYANSEAQRILQFGVLYAALAAASALAPKPPTRGGAERPRWAALVACASLGFLSTILLQALVADFW
jgi:hypothetical protein